jgi:outer membrane receptor protein involved in Fe transport
LSDCSAWLSCALAAITFGVPSLAGAQASPGAATSAPVADGTADAALETTDATAPSFETLVEARRPVSAASSARVRDRDFALRPHPRPADILSVAPGMFVVQHAGGGKANQYFLRGFDADHGTDVAISVDGVPVNLVSHGHGQGYADLNWVIPELVERIEVNKGPYLARHGDFATAGALELVTRQRLEENQLSFAAGSFGTLRGFAGLSPDFGARTSALFAAELYATDGPFEREEELTRLNLFTRLTHALDPHSSLDLTLTQYSAAWNASGQIPLRALRAGTLDRFGTLDPSDGGASSRSSAALRYSAEPSEGSELSLLAYVADYRLSLFSNFTFFSRDPENGDQIEQNDARLVSGATAEYAFTHGLGGVTFVSRVGADARRDHIDNALHYDRARERLSHVVDAGIDETRLSLYGEEEITWSPLLRSVLGVRLDRFNFDVDDRREDLATLGTQSSGVRDALGVSPKASLIVSPLADWDVFLNFGYGFHSNDARGVVRAVDPVTPLTRAIGAELGTRVSPAPSLDIAMALFGLDLAHETVWVGDEGTTETRGPTRRLGAELELRYAPLEWLVLDADASWTRARFRDAPSGADAVPLAPELLLSGGASVRHPSGLYGRLGSVYVGDRPATEDRFLSAEGFFRLDATLGYRAERFELALAAQNLLDTEWREAQFGNVSRLQNESTCPAGTRAQSGDAGFAGCEDLHFTPGAPLSASATLSLYF